MRFLLIGILVFTQVYSLPADSKDNPIPNEVSSSDAESIALEDEYAAIVSNAEVRAKSQEVYKKISDPKDTDLQSQIKAIMAEYLVVTAITEEENDEPELGLGNSIGGKAFGRDKHRPHHHNNRDRDRNRNRDRDNLSNPNPSSSPVIVQVQNYLPAPAQNYQPAAVPVQNYQPAAVPVQNYQPAPAPVQNYQPAPAPVQNYQPAPAPVQNYQPAPAPVQNYQPAPAPVQNYQPAPAPVQNYQPAAVPASAVIPAQNNEVRQDVTTAAPIPIAPQPQQTQVPIITQAPQAQPPAPIQQQPPQAPPQAPPQPPPQVQAPPQPQPPPVTQAPVIAQTQPPVTQAPITRRPTVDPVHHLNQVNKILGNVATGNIVGIVDESLAIRTPQPVRTLVTNILKVVFCNPIDRIFNRCAPNQIAAANTRQ